MARKLNFPIGLSKACAPLILPSRVSYGIKQAPEGVTDPTKTAPKGQVLVVKSGGRDSIPNPLVVSEPAVIVPASSVRELPCSNQFDALQLMDKENTSRTVMVSEAAEVHLDSGKVIQKESLGAASIRTDPSSSKIMEEPHYGTLPDVLGEGSVERIIVAWDTQGPKVNVLASSDQMMLLSVMVDSRTFALSAVYGFNQAASRRQLWDELRIGFGTIGDLP
ncbi:hypothetical protein RHMOL_Rhmol07G0144100 [Rhododendron molle]|uniref:Uncharacterized protein n=1 Tax=Rhododendron molle TaxID=49168 RepID=A0ACC0N1J9_RHOML|nr:hypothetical protein RHMOL_Rhmol07G0144100 [Rhododendron molle]